MSFEQTKWVWMNGELVPWASANTHVSARALHYGSGVFEGMRCYETLNGPAVFRLDAHLERLYSSAEIYGAGNSLRARGIDRGKSSFLPGRGPLTWAPLDSRRAYE